MWVTSPKADSRKMHTDLGAVPQFFFNVQTFMNLLQTSSNNTEIIYDGDLLSTLPATVFDGQTASKENTLGRGTAIFFSIGTLQVVLKRYARGGMVRHFVKRSYLFISKEKTRMWQEFHLLCHMKSLGLPVPAPVAARCVRPLPLFYQGDLITQKIEHSETLFERLITAPINAESWRSVGKTIRRFHDEDIFHADLNANNIMLDNNNSIYLIDFDKGSIKPKEKSYWTKANLSRLLRSLRKFKANTSVFYFEDDDWQNLQAGYAESK